MSEGIANTPLLADDHIWAIRLKSTWDIGIAALAGLAGGLIGNKIGHGKWSTLVGPTIGRIGASVAYKKYEERKHRGRDEYNDYGYNSY